MQDRSYRVSIARFGEQAYRWGGVGGFACGPETRSRQYRNGYALLYPVSSRFMGFWMPNFEHPPQPSHRSHRDTERIGDIRARSIR